MSCSRFIRILADFQQGKLLSEEQMAADAHLAHCPACRRLVEIAQGRIDILPESGRDELTRSILDRTSGPSCPRAESSLWEFAGGELSAGDSQMIALHLDHCSACRAIAGDFDEIQRVLPEIAGFEPDGLFTRDVLCATSGAKIPDSKFVIPDENLSIGSQKSRFGNRIQTAWHRIVQRPCFSLEAAYVGTLVLLVAFSPFLPIRKTVFDRIPAAASQPSTYLLSTWSNTQSPISDGLCKFALALGTRDQAIADSLSRLVTCYERPSGSTLSRRAQRISEWRRREAGILATFLMRLKFW